MAAVVCRTGTKAQTEFSTEKLHIKKNISTHHWNGEIKMSILIVFVAVGLV
jgi:hypothetical protein